MLAINVKAKMKETHVCCLRSILAGTDLGAFMTTKIDRQMGPNPNIVLYHVQLWIAITWSRWLWLLVMNSKPNLNESLVSISAFGPCWEWWRCICDKQNMDRQLNHKPRYVAIPCANLKFYNIIIVGGGFWWPIWSRNCMNHTFSMLRLVLVRVDVPASMATNMHRQMDQHLHVLLYQCKFQLLWHDHVGGRNWWSIWNRH